MKSIVFPLITEFWGLNLSHWKKKKHSKLITIYSFLENFHRKNAGKSRPDRKLHIPGVPWPGSSESQEQQLSVPVDSPQQTRHSLFKPRNLLHEQLFCKNWVGCLCTHMKIDVKNWLEAQKRASCWCHVLTCFNRAHSICCTHACPPNQRRPHTSFTSEDRAVYGVGTAVPELSWGWATATRSKPTAQQQPLEQDGCDHTWQSSKKERTDDVGGGM